MISPACDLPYLCGKIVLIAEPNALIAMDLAATFSGWGARPLLYCDLDGPAQLTALATADAALVDVPLNREPLASLIQALKRRGVPTVLTTAGAAHNLSGEFPGLKIFEKPVVYPALAQWFCSAVSPQET